jgi:competence protein ComGC
MKKSFTLIELIVIIFIIVIFAAMPTVVKKVSGHHGPHATPMTQPAPQSQVFSNAP